MNDPVPLSVVGRLRRANKAEVAEFFEVSIKAVDGWVRRGCPVVERGRLNKPWVFDLLAVAEWRIAGTSANDCTDPTAFPPAERKAWFESELKRRELQERDRELIPAAELESCVARVFGALSQGLRSIPDNLERRIGCSAEVAEAVERILEAEMDAAADMLASIAPVDCVNE